MRVRLYWLSCLLLLWTGCSDDLDPPSRVIELRLLALTADSPFARPGQQVNLSALAVDPEARPLTWAWGTCINADSSTATDCLQTLSFESLSIGRDRPTHTLTVPETEAPYLGVVVIVCPGTITSGRTEGLPIACNDDSGAALPFSEYEVGVKRIFLRDPAQNQNPVIESVLWEGTPWPEGELKTTPCKVAAASGCREFEKHAIEVRAPGAAESSVDAEGKALTELAVTQFYATAGTFEDEVRVYDRATNDWHARAEDAGKRITLWFVVRDDRGGMTWTSRQIQAE